MTFPDWLWFLTKLNCRLLDLALALLNSEGDDVKVHAVAAQLDILGGTTALLVAADQAVLHVDSVPVQDEGEAAGAGPLPHFHPLASKGILEKYLLVFFPAKVWMDHLQRGWLAPGEESQMKSVRSSWWRSPRLTWPCRLRRGI